VLKLVLQDGYRLRDTIFAINSKPPESDSPVNTPSYRLLWLETMMPEICAAELRANCTSSAVVVPFNQVSMLVRKRSHGSVLSQAMVSSSQH
jgi:hypothetical protein